MSAGRPNLGENSSQLFLSCSKNVSFNWRFSWDFICYVSLYNLYRVFLLHILSFFFSFFLSENSRTCTSFVLDFSSFILSVSVVPWIFGKWGFSALSWELLVSVLGFLWGSWWGSSSSSTLKPKMWR